MIFCAFKKKTNLNVITNSEARLPKHWQIVDDVVKGTTPKKVINGQTAET